MLWTAGVATELAVPVFPVDIDDAGQILGSMGIAHPFVWPPPGTLRNLGPLVGPLARVAALNNLGEVALTTNDRAALWTEAGGAEQLGTLGGTWSTATGINNLGHVVGFSEDSICRERAFLWTREAGMQDLLAIVAPGAP